MMTTHLSPVLHPPSWLPARGYSNGVIAHGTLVVLAGQIGWNPATGKFETADFAQQVRQTLNNIVAILGEAHAKPEHIVRMTWYITDKPAYMNAQREIGQIYREIIGKHYPSMSVVVVSGLIEDEAKVEIEVTAVLPGSVS